MPAWLWMIKVTTLCGGFCRQMPVIVSCLGLLPTSLADCFCIKSEENIKKEPAKKMLLLFLPSSGPNYSKLFCFHVESWCCPLWKDPPDSQVHSEMLVK